MAQWRFTRSAATANSLSLIPQFLPFVSSAFVPTDSMPAGVGWFAEHQPYTPLIETLRALLTGAPVGDRWVLATAWCVVMGLAGYVWSRQLYKRDPSRQSSGSVAELLSR